MNTTTLNTAHRHAAKAATASGWTTTLRHAVEQAAASLRRWAMEPRVTLPDTAQRLLALADAYQATQPSYAADLRAAALRTPEMHRHV
jgi:hypothetical protein